MIALKLRILKSEKRFVMALLFMLSFATVAFSQNRVITGIVTNAETNEPLSGVSIAVKGTTKTVFTDASGRYSIQAASSNVLVFRYIGFYAKEIPVAEKKVINTSLAVDMQSLDEVVVVGYGEVAKSDLTGSIGQVNVEELSLAPVMSFDQALAGRIAGVQVSSADGQPGSEGVNIVIRGAGSLTQSTARYGSSMVFRLRNLIHHL